MRATGLMVTTPLGRGGPAAAYGTVVDDRTYAPFHQHFLVARLDLDIDGDDNTVLEVDSRGARRSRPTTRTDWRVVTESTPIDSERESARDFNWETQRAWKVINPNRTNRHGTTRRTSSCPARAIPAMMDPGAPQYLSARR